MSDQNAGKCSNFYDIQFRKPNRTLNFIFANLRANTCFGYMKSVSSVEPLLRCGYKFSRNSGELLDQTSKLLHLAHLFGHKLAAATTSQSSKPPGLAAHVPLHGKQLIRAGREVIKPGAHRAVVTLPVLPRQPFNCNVATFNVRSGLFSEAEITQTQKAFLTMRVLFLWLNVGSI